MERKTLQGTVKNPNFIGAWMIKPDDICDKIIDHFEKNKDKQLSGALGGGVVNLDRKNSIDIMIKPRDVKLPENVIFKEYLSKLFACYEDYLQQWPFLQKLAKKVEISDFNLQRYQKGQHFQVLHAERSSLGTLHRLFAWMTYLNDVDIADGGSTFFSHYDIDIQPQKGLTLIWPAEWTHAHKGNLIKRNTKYIITGWMHFPS